MKQKYLSSGIQKKYLKSTLILLLLALLLSMIGVWSYMHHTLKNNIIEKYEFADEKMGILLDNLYTKSKEVTAEAILNETIQKSLNAEELTDNEKNAVANISHIWIWILFKIIVIWIIKETYIPDPIVM